MYSTVPAAPYNRPGLARFLVNLYFSCRAASSLRDSFAQEALEAARPDANASTSVSALINVSRDQAKVSIEVSSHDATVDLEKEVR